MDLLRDHILKTAKARWFYPIEIEFILKDSNWIKFGLPISSEPPVEPRDGHIYLYDRFKTAKYKNDGIQYVLKKSKDRIQESFHNFKINGTERINAVYSRALDNKNFSRRIFRLIGSTNTNIVLVHYRDSPDDINNNYSTYGGSIFDWMRENMTSINPAREHSVSNVSSFITSESSMPVIENYSNNSSELHDQTGLFDAEVLRAIADMNDDNSPFLDDMLHTNEFELFDSFPTEPSYNSSSHVQHTGDNYSSASKYPNRITHPTDDSGLLNIVDYCPIRDYCEGGSKMLILFDKVIPVEKQSNVKVMFGNIGVRAEIKSPSGISCTIPQSPLSGSCVIQVMIDEGNPLSYACPQKFEYIAYRNDSDIGHANHKQRQNQYEPLSATEVPSRSIIQKWYMGTTDEFSDDRVHKIRIVEKLGKTIGNCIPDDSHLLPSNGSNNQNDVDSTASYRQFVSSASFSPDPSVISWLSDAELSKLSPNELEQVMDKYVTEVIHHLLHYTEIDDDLKTEIESLDQFGFALLHYCCMYNLFSLIPVLIAKSCTLNLKSRHGKTPLHIAIEGENLEIIHMLTSAGADYNIKDDEGNTPRELGLHSRRREIVNYCQHHMSDKSHERINETIYSNPNRIESFFESSSVDALDDSRSPHSMAISDSSTKLLYEAFSSFSLADKCALSLSFSQNSAEAQSSKASEVEKPYRSKFESLSSVNSNDYESTDGIIRTNSREFVSENIKDSRELSVINEIHSVISESDKESLDVAMSMMGHTERLQVENEVRLIQSNVRAWLLRKNYISLRDSVKTLQSLWREKRKSASMSMGAYGDPITRKRPLRGRTNGNIVINRDERSNVVTDFKHSNDMNGFIQNESLSNDQSFTQYDERHIQAVATLQAATRGMIARKSFSKLQRQAMASVVIQKSFLSWWTKKSHAYTKQSA